MKYAIQLSMYKYDSEKDEEYEEWEYLGIQGEHKIFVLDEEINEQTKIFNSAKEAGEYVDKRFSDTDDYPRCSYSSVRIVEV